CDGTHVVSPSCAEAVTIAQNGAVSYVHAAGGISTASYKTLDWYVYLNGASIDSFQTYLEDVNDNHIKDVTLSSTYVVGTSNGFTHVSIPISTLHPNNTPFARF